MAIHFVNYAIDVSDLVTAIIGGLIGALAAGVPSYMIARMQARELLRRDSDARTREERALAITTAIKFIQIVNSLVGLRNHVEACFVVSEGEKMEAWQRLIPMVGHSDEANLRFNDSEITLLARARQSDLMQDLLLLANKHSSAIVAWQDYCRRREEVAERAPKPTSFEGERGSTRLTAEQVNALKVYTIPLDNLALGLRAHLDEYVEFARKIAVALPEAYSSYFGIENVIDLSFPSDAELDDQVKIEADRISRRK